MVASRAMPAIWATEQREESTHRVEVFVQSESSHWVATLSARQGFEIVRGNAASVDRGASVRIVCAGSDVVTGLTLVSQLRTSSAVPIALVLEGLADTAFAEARDAAFAQGASEVLRGEEAQRVADLASFFAGGAEQRQPRHRVRVSATVSRPDGTRVPGLVESVSRAGLQVRASVPFVAGEARHLMVELAKDSHFGFWGLVRGTAPAGPSSTVARLRFVGTLPSERAAIERFLDGLERETRSTDPSDAFQEIRRLDESAVIVALGAGATPPDWLAGAIPSLTRSERLALQRADGSIVWRAAALARTRGAALTTVLERFDPVLDDEPRNARDTVVDVLDRLASAQREFVRLGERELAGEAGDVDLVVEGLQQTTQRLERAVAARLPHLAAAREMVSGRSDQLRRLERTENTLWGRRPLRERRNQLLAVLAGLMIGFAVVYTIASLIASAPGS